MTDTSSQVDSSGLLLAADGTPLKRKLRQALSVNRRRAFLLVAPLLLFIFASFALPIAVFLWQGFHNDTYESRMPASSAVLSDWDGSSEPTEEMAAALVADLIVSRKAKTIGKVATRVNVEQSGTRSLFTKTARRAAKMEAPFLPALINVDKDWGDLETWQAMKIAATSFTPAYFAAAIDKKYNADGSFTDQEETRQIYVWLFVKTFLVSAGVMAICVLLGFPVAYLIAHLPARQANLLIILVLLPFWTSLLVRTTAWIAMLQGEGVINDGLDYMINNDIAAFLGPALLGISNAFLGLVGIAAEILNILLAVINFVIYLAWLVIAGAVELFELAFEKDLSPSEYWVTGYDKPAPYVPYLGDVQKVEEVGYDRLSLIYNMTGTVIAMTHILLPFMILPIYSVMKAIPPSHVRAAKSLGATNWTAFWRVYFPATIPGIGAGGLLVFILAIGYYITPALVGGSDGQLISNFIAYHMEKSLNYSLAAALGGILLVSVLILYWLYDRIVGIDNMKLG